MEERALVIELVEGATLAGPLSPEEVLPVIQQLIDALEYAHDKGIIHRDLKPANIKVTPEGRVKVLDFGLAKAMSEEAPAGDPSLSPTLTMRATMAGAIMGTAAYVSPEQARGQAVDRRADIWSFGVVVYEILTGKPLVDASTVTDTLAAVLTRDPELAAVPARFHRLLRLSLARDLRQRLRDISAARLLLDEPGSSDVRAISRPWVAASVVAAAALAGALAATWIAPRFRPAQPPAGVVRFQIPISEKTPLVNSSVFAVSPDGSKLTYYARGGEAMVLWVRSMDSLESPELPGTDTLNGSAAPIFWSPDSRWIAFQGLRGLMKVEARGGPAQTVCTLAGSTAGGSWSRDGVILFAHNAGAVMRGKKSGSYRL